MHAWEIHWAFAASNRLIKIYGDEMPRTIGRTSLNIIVFRELKQFVIIIIVVNWFGIEFHLQLLLTASGPNPSPLNQFNHHRCSEMPFRRLSYLIHFKLIPFEITAYQFCWNFPEAEAVSMHTRVRHNAFIVTANPSLHLNSIKY